MKELVGLVLPPVIDLINKHLANSVLKFWVSLTVCVVVAVAVNLDKLNNPEDLLGKIALVFAEAQIIYKTYYEKSGIRAKIIK